MKWPVSSRIECWLIWASRSLKPFDGKADISITWRPREKPAFRSGTSTEGEQDFSVESQKCCRQISPGHVQAEARALENPNSGKGQGLKSYRSWRVRHLLNSERPTMNAALETGCCIVGGGPAGMMLGFLLARSGVDV